MRARHWRECKVKYLIKINPFVVGRGSGFSSLRKDPSLGSDTSYVTFLEFLTHPHSCGKGGGDGGRMRRVFLISTFIHNNIGGVIQDFPLLKFPIFFLVIWLIIFQPGSGYIPKTPSTIWHRDSVIMMLRVLFLFFFFLIILLSKIIRTLESRWVLLHSHNCTIWADIYISALFLIYQKQ